jgi:hypothetical protein
LPTFRRDDADYLYLQLQLPPDNRVTKAIARRSASDTGGVSLSDALRAAPACSCRRAILRPLVSSPIIAIAFLQGYGFELVTR